MKKIRKMICIATVTLMACFACTACGTTYQEAVSEEYATDDSICGNYFTTITEWDDTTAYYKIAYAKDTKVKYLIIVSGYKFGITPLYNADGTLYGFKCGTNTIYSTKRGDYNDIYRTYVTKVSKRRFAEFIY